MNFTFRNGRRINYLPWQKFKRLYEYDRVPKHLQTNSSVINGYRHDLSWSECFKSFFPFLNGT